MTELFWARVIVNGTDRGGGVVLAPRMLVTAAHCVHGVERNDAGGALEVEVAGSPTRFRRAAGTRMNSTNGAVHTEST